MLVTILGGVSNWDNHMGGGWWWLMGIGWLVFLAIIVGVVLVLVRHTQRTSVGSRTAHDVLDERFARGEIDENEYRQRRDVLRN
jgi:putative membrane protein